MAMYDGENLSERFVLFVQFLITYTFLIDLFIKDFQIHHYKLLS